MNKHPVLSEMLSRLPDDQPVILANFLVNQIQEWAAEGDEECQRYAARISEGNLYTPEGAT